VNPSKPGKMKVHMFKGGLPLQLAIIVVCQMAFILFGTFCADRRVANMLKGSAQVTIKEFSAVSWATKTFSGP
jgi:hypothetical protein